MPEKPELLQEELDQEYSWMDARKKHSYNHKMINRKMRARKITLIALITFLSISALAVIFVLVFQKQVDTELTSKVGIYEIQCSDELNSAGCYLEYNYKKLSTDTNEGRYTVLYASGRTGSVSRGNGEITTLLSSTGTNPEIKGDNVFEVFVNNIVKNSQLPTLNTDDLDTKHVEKVGKVGTELGTQYFDADDKSYVAFFYSYFVNRFYLVNTSEADIDYNLIVSFIKKENFELYKASRLILAINDGDTVKYYGFAAERAEGEEPEIMATKQRDASGTNPVGREFLLDPNKPNVKAGSTKVVKIEYSHDNERYEAPNPEDTWYPIDLKLDGQNQNGEDMYRFKSANAADEYFSSLTVKAKSSIEISLLFIAAESSDYDFNAEAMSNNQIGVEILFDKK